MAHWHETSGRTKFRLYTRVSLQGAVVVTVIAVAFAAAGAGDGPQALVGVVVTGLAALAALEAQPELAKWPHATFPRWALPTSAVTLTVVWAGAAIIATVAKTDSVVDQARAAGIYAAMFAALSIVAFTRFKWWILTAMSIATGLAFGSSPGSDLRVMATSFLLGVFVMATTLLTLWGIQIMDDLEHAKDLAAELQLAEERLRFSRDLHDVVGRNFSAIAVKSELAAALSRAGVVDRATEEMDEVRTLAVDSMAEMRQLVRGYRDIDLAGEVAGARSLLSATGCALGVEGDPMNVPLAFHELAAWVVREGTTNIVKHSAASSATFAFGPAGMSLRNDGVTGAPKDHSGLAGLAGRLATGGATLDTVVSGEEFILEIHWETA